MPSAHAAAAASTADTLETLTRCVARQPIFDRERRLSGYELLFRAHHHATTAAGGLDDSQMSSATLVHGVLDIGLDALTGPTPAWINAARDLLVSGALTVLDPKRVVIEVLERVTIDADVVAACQRLRGAGYTLALDDFEGGDEWVPLLQIAHIVKLDVLNVPIETLRARVARLRPYGVRLLAERVEDAEVFADCLRLGFDLFQGYHFRRPEVVQRKTLPIGIARVARLIALVGNQAVTDGTIEEELRADPGLSVKLLRIVNNAATGNREVTSLRHAIQLAGRRALHQWLTILLVSSVPTSGDVEREIVLNALERGRFCELMALEAGRGELAEPLFLVGVLSDLDHLLGVPMADLIRDLGVSNEVAAALRHESSPHTPYLHVATAYAAGEWSRVADTAAPLGVHGELPTLYGEAGGWARQVLRSR